jgi:hypothetical protein
MAKNVSSGLFGNVSTVCLAVVVIVAVAGVWTGAEAKAMPAQGQDDCCSMLLAIKTMPKCK